MQVDVPTKGARIAAHSTGSGPPVVMLHALGTDRSVWDPLIALMPDHRIITMDLRGHGASSVPVGPYSMGGLISDVESVLDHLAVRDAVVIGLCLGGMLAQGLAVKRLDLVRAMVLCCTAAKLGQPDSWHARAAVARTDGVAVLAPAILARWGVVGPNAENRLSATPPEGYAGCCEALAGTDFYTPTSGLRLPTLGLTGDRDKSTPPDLVRETTHLVPGATFQLIRGAGHLAPETHAPEVARHVHAFLGDIAHV